MAAEFMPDTPVEQGGASRQRRSSLATIALRQESEPEILPLLQKFHQPGSEVPCGDVPQAYGVDGPKISVAPAHTARPRRRPSSGFKLRQPATRAVRRRSKAKAARLPLSRSANPAAGVTAVQLTCRLFGRRRRRVEPCCDSHVCSKACPDDSNSHQ